MLPRSLLFPVVLILGGCATHISTDVTQNPPPAQKLSDFNHFELEPVILAPAYQASDANHQAMAKIQQNLLERMNPVLAKWNQSGDQAGGPRRTLLIEPEIEEIKFLNATVRVWTGALSGSSAVLMHVRLMDKDNGREIAAPVFYARAAAMSGAWTFGVMDNMMLVRITDTVSAYLQNNYSQAVGGPTGQDPRK